VSRAKASLDHRRIRRLIWLVLTVFLLLGYSLQSVAGTTYYSNEMQNYATVSTPPVILQNGTAGTSTIYTNNTSAKVNVSAPLFDYVDNDDSDVDSSEDKGTHSNFPAQQAGPDSTYDTLTEENTEAIEDHVDNISDVDNSPDVGTHSNFENQKAQDSSYDTLTEASQENTYSLDATGGYMIIGDGTPDWGSSTGTISFWVKMDNSVQGRFYGQNGDMETRWSGTNLVLDWGATTSITSVYSFSADTWYFVAIVWDENNDNLFLYVGDENNAPTLDENSLSGTWTSTTPAPTENRFLNGLGGSEPVDGHGDDLRYWNITRNLTEIQSDYNQTLSGSEPNLQSYFKLDDNFADSGPNNDDGTGSPTYSFSSDVPFSGSSDYDLDLEVQWTNIIDFLPTEKLCIYTGTLGSEDLGVDYWNGTGWENLATDLTAYSCNYYTVSLTPTIVTIRFRGGNDTSDTIQDQWQIDASSLRVEGAGDKEDAVDNETSDEDSSSDLGVLTDFTNMTAYDANMANLTETTGGVDGDWGDTNNPGGTASPQTTARAMGGISPDMDNMTLTSISVWWGGTGTGRLAVYQGGALDNPNGATLVWDAGQVAIPATAGWVTISGGSASLAKNTPTWLAWKCNDANYYYRTSWDSASDFQSERGRVQLNDEGAASTDVWDATIGAFNFGNYWYDIYINYTIPANYQLDQEVQWTDIPYLLPNENLSIYGGTMGAEDLEVDVWNGTGWETVFADLSSGWNNASITNWLTTSNFTIRFKGGTETSDTNEDTWQVDVALIHIWYDGGESYELNLEVQWTNTDYTRTNEELCIKTGTFSGSENIQVRVWNNTGNSWHWVMNLTANQWNNVSITSYLTSSTFTVQVLGGTETSDITQDNWNIDATLLHVWTSASTWLSGWDKRVKITIDHDDIDSYLSDSPVLVYLSNSSGRNNDDVTFVFDEVGANSKKIAVTTSDEITQCYVEIEKWDATNNKAWLWVKVPSISNTVDTDLYLYYDNAHADNTDYVGVSGSTPAQNVWGADTLAVWHMFDAPNSTLLDSTSNNNTVNKRAANLPLEVDDQIAKAQYFNSDWAWDWSKENLDGVNNTTGLTISAWYKPDGSNPSFHFLLTKNTQATADTQYGMYIRTPNAGGVMGASISASNVDITGSSQVWENGVVYYVTLTWDGSTLRGYVNGVQVGNNISHTTTMTPLGNKINLGRRSNSADGSVSTGAFQGTLDEIRLEKTAHPIAWIKASYESGRDDLLDFGEGASEETSESTFDYVLRVNNTVTDSWEIRLKKYADSDVNRLQDCTIYFHNSSDGTSNQIIIENGSYINQTGPWYDLGESETIYIAMTVKANSAATSYVYAYLEIRTPNTTTCAQYAITFEIT
jgi:hypothetical protein